MTLPPPKIDSRTYTKLVAETEELAQQFSPWKPPADGKADAGRALIRIFGRMAAMITDRLNRVPEKHFLAFLNLIGAKQQPPRPARVPLTAYLVDNSPVEAIVPAHTQIAVLQQSGDTEEILFETEQDLVVVRSQLQATIVHQAKQYCDHILTATTAIGKFPVFQIEQPNTLYIAADQLTTKIDSQEIQLAIANSDKLTERWKWSYWDGETWHALTPEAKKYPVNHSENNRLKLTVSEATLKNWKPPQPKVIEGVEAQWLRAIAPKDLPDMSPQLVRAATEKVTPDQAFFNTEEIDLSKDFLPLGEIPQIGDTFYIASKELLANAERTITIDLTQSKGRESKPDQVTILWEVWTDKSWKPVLKKDANASRQNANAANESEFSNGLNGKVEFKLPAGITPVEINGKENYWLRARLAAGKYGSEPKFKTKITGTPPNTETTLEQLPDTGYFPPSLKSITLSRSEIADIEPKKLLKALPSGAFIYDDPNSVKTIFYIASDQISALPNSIEIRLKKSSISQWNEWQWTYWDGQTWQRLSGKEDDQSVTLTLDQSLSTASQTPGKPSQKVIEGVQAQWLRGIASKVLSEPKESVIFLNSSSSQPNSREAPARKQFIKIIPVDFYLCFDRPFPNQAIALYLQLAPPEPGALRTSTPPQDPAKLQWEYSIAEGWRSLNVQDGTQNLRQRGMVQFIGPSDFAPQTLFGRSGYWLRLRLLKGDFQIQPCLQRVLTNTVWAIQAITYQDEVLGNGTGDPNLVLHTLHTPVLPGQQLLVRESELPSPEEQAEIKKLEGNDAIAISTDASGQPEEIWVRWHEVSDFYASGSRDRHYTLDRMTGEIRFGGDGQGMAPPSGRNNIRIACYQTGGGSQGNCAAETLTELKTTVPYIDRVTNHEPGGGGADLESIAAVQESGPKQLRHGDRAVTWQDIEDLTYAASSDIVRVKVLTPPKFTPTDPLKTWIAPSDKTASDIAMPGLSEGLKQAGKVTVIIVPSSNLHQPTPSLALIEQVKRYLKERLDPGLTLEITEPVWIEVTVTATVVPSSLSVANDLQAVVQSSLVRFLHPLTGGTKQQGWAFGRHPHDSDLYAQMERIPGVSYVKTLEVTTKSSIKDDEVTTKLSIKDDDRFLIYSGQHDITIGSLP